MGAGSRRSGSSAPGRIGRDSQHGASAVEFALVLPLLLLLTYGVIVYAYVFVLRQSVNFAAQEAAQSAVAVDPAAGGGDAGDYQALVTQRVLQTVESALGWLPAAQRTPPRLTTTSFFCGASAGNLNCPVDGGAAVVVTLTFSIDAPGPLLPVLSLPGLGQVPPLPQQLQSVAVVRL